MWGNSNNYKVIKIKNRKMQIKKLFLSLKK